MIDVLIVHGSFGSPFGNWAPWLHQRLSDSGKVCIVPHFTSGDLQNLDSWTRILDGYSDLISEKTTVIGHSLGPAFCADWLIQKGKKIDHFVGVCPFYSLIGIEEFDKVNSSFFIKDIDLSILASLTLRRTCVFSDNDPYVNRSLSESFAQKTSSQMRVIPGGAHLNSSAGFDEFPSLLEIVNK